MRHIVAKAVKKKKMKFNIKKMYFFKYFVTHLEISGHIFDMKFFFLPTIILVLVF